MCSGVSEPIFANFVLQPLRLADGSVSGVFCQGYEMTSRQAATAPAKARAGNSG